MVRRTMVKGDLEAEMAYTLQVSWDLRDGFYAVTKEEHQLSRQRRMAECSQASGGTVE